MEYTITSYGRLEYSIDRSARRKNAYITIDRGEVLVKLPLRAGNEYAEALVQKNAKWIADHLNRQPEDYKSTQEYADGELFEVLGKPYTLCVEFNDKSRFCADILDGRLLVSIPKRYRDNPREHIKSAIDSFYDELTHHELEHCMPELERQLKVSPEKLTVRPMKTAWGICYTNGNITINRYISLFPRSVIEYLALHELCHLIHHDHSREYWKLVESCMPDYKTRRTALKTRYPLQ